jgi:hypothetical protein
MHFVFMKNKRSKPVEIVLRREGGRKKDVRGKSN